MNAIDNPQIALARQIVENTDTHLFLTGKAGTGKTTFLRRLRKDLPKRMVVLAPTGIAAINAEGMTIHSFFQLPFVPYVPGGNYQQDKKYSIRKEKLRLIRSLDLLVIDEISMVRADLLDAVDEMLRKIRRNQQPFGGVQLLLIGDLQQLAPVVKDEEWTMLRQYYETPFFFSSLALKRSNFVTVELEKVYRQNDENFISLLNSIREGRADTQVLQRLNQRYVPGFKADKSEGYVQLVTHNWQAHKINEEELSSLPGESRTYTAKIEGKFPEYSYPTDEELVIKSGAQVMFVKNDTEKRFFNGMIGEVTNVSRDGFDVRPKDKPDMLISVKPEEWTNTRYGLDEQTKEIKEFVDGTFVQYPVKLAWAITIHKSQGLTFDHVMIDASGAFAHGQTYVALSRCRTLEGIVLTSVIPPSAVIADQNIEKFNERMRNSRVDGEKLSAMRQSFELHLLTELFKFERERIALSSITEILRRHLAGLYGKTLQEFDARLRVFDLEVMNVSGSFYSQYSRMLAQTENSAEDVALQQRIAKGAEYFSTKLDELGRWVALHQIESDNAAVEKQLKSAFSEWKEAVSAHLKLLHFVAYEGFKASQFLNYRAKVLLEADDKMAPANTRKQKAKSGAKNAVNDKYVVPTEVKNASLYYTLQTWRREKALERKLPAYTILSTKALMTMANHAPTTMEELKKVPYFGAKSLANYGAELLQLISKSKSKDKKGIE